MKEEKQGRPRIESEALLHKLNGIRGAVVPPPGETNMKESRGTLPDVWKNRTNGATVTSWLFQLWKQNS